MRNNRGSVLIFSYLIVAAMVALGSAMTVRTMTEQNTSSRSVRLASAFQSAEAGLDQALIELRADPDWNGASATEVPNGGYYAVAVEDDEAGNLALTITGHYPTNDPTVLGYQRRQVEAVVQISSPSVFQYPLFGEDSVTLDKDMLTDSYNSDDGDGDYDPDTAGDNGNVATNGTGDNSITIDKDSTINGQVIVGPDMDDPTDAASIDSSVEVTANPDVASASASLELPDVDTSGLSCTTALALPKNGTYTFQEADSPYCYTSITADSGSVVAVSGNVVVYAQSIDFDKNFEVNTAGKPTQFILQVYGTNDVVIDKEGTFVGALYAPEAKVRLKKEVDVYGAIAAESIDIDKGSEFHYDEALANVGPSGGGDADALLVSWREL